MEPCQGLIVINTGAAALISAAGLALSGAIGMLFREVIKGRDNHIHYASTVNADLTETNQILAGTTKGAVETVRRGTRTTGRAGQ